MTSTSRWAYGTYEMLLQLPSGEDGDLLMTIFAKPADADDEPSDEDAPVLAQSEHERWDVGLRPDDPYPWRMGLRTVGLSGVAPEAMEREFGPQMAICALWCLYQAATNDINGLDLDDMPWRMPSGNAEELRERVYRELARLSQL